MGVCDQNVLQRKIFTVLEECPLKNHNNCKKRPSTLKGPLRVIRLCVLGIFLPSLFIAVPLYMRYHVYGHQLYPLAMSDMRLIDNKVSTTWCQRQLVKVNTTFNAFLLENSPSLASHLKPLTMVRHLSLEDDTKEYWGFYLLQGSSVTVSTCVRWPGSSLIVIRGHKHLHECAYIGDDSSEELDELMEAIREGNYVRPENKKQNSTPHAPVNEPDMMKRHRVDVEFHHPIHKNNTKNYTIKDAVDDADITDPKALQTLLDSLQAKAKENQKQTLEEKYMHVHRNSTIAEGESKNFQIEAPHSDQTHSQETYADIMRKLESLGNKSNTILDQINKKFGGKVNNSEDNLVQEPHQQVFDVKGRHYSKPSVHFDDNIDRARRRRREIIISNAMHSNLTEDDEERNLGVEEEFTPDGIADHRGTINETTLNDYSNSEFWSSFSSSEEALLNCAGLILNLPLTPHHKCVPELTEEQAEETYLANTITYKVPVNGYYFFVFNSENEVQTNYIRVQFHLNKAVYNVSNAVSTCMNSSETCAMDLKFFSSEKLVMELPVRENSSLWNEEFVVVSECEPRTILYAMCVIAVPVLVILFAFS
jgi:peptidyl-prolyl cis-trans isomerase SDCCAG10